MRGVILSVLLTPAPVGTGLGPGMPLFSPLLPAQPSGLSAGSMDLRSRSVLPSVGPVQVEDGGALDRVGRILSRGGGIAPEDRAFLDEWFPRLYSLGKIGRPPTAFERSWTERRFPRLRGRDDWRVTGERCEGYNCISWSVGVTDDWLWPSDLEEDYDAFYAARGYVRSSEEEADIALWVDPDGEATHACRRLAGGWWESKLGAGPRILHRLEALGGSDYGRPFKFYRKQSS